MWGEIFEWDSKLIEIGDWTAAVWRSPKLAHASQKFANHTNLRRMRDIHGVIVHATGQILRANFKKSDSNTQGSFPILKSEGSNAQIHIQSTPDEYWISKMGIPQNLDKILLKSGYLLITAGQNNRSARLTAVANDTKYAGNSWIPITGISSLEAKAAAVFINSTPGRLQIMRTPGRTLIYPIYSVMEMNNIRIPNIKDTHICNILSDCWELTKNMKVPQFRDGECEVRALWDESVADAMQWDAQELTRLRLLLHREPHVCGLGYNEQNA